jgi:hypothetical protein
MKAVDVTSSGLKLAEMLIDRLRIFKILKLLASSKKNWSEKRLPWKHVETTCFLDHQSGQLHRTLLTAEDGKSLTVEV